MALHKLVFDATDADTQAASSNVGAYLRASDGTLLTHTDVGGKKALDVRVAEGINVEVDLNFADDSVDASGSVIALDAATLAALESITVQNGAGASAVNIQDGGNSITVDATDLDIRNLVFATDKVDVSGSEVSLDAATLAALETVTVLQGTSPWVIGDGGSSISIDDNGGSITVDGTLAVTQSTSPWVVSDAALADTAISAVPETVGTTIGQIVDGLDELANRKYLYLYNNGNRVAYVGQSGITTSTGFPIPPGSILEARIGAAVDVYMIADAAAQNIRTLQLS